MNWLKRFYNWLFRIQAPYQQYRVKAIIKVGKTKFKVKAKDYEEFVKIIVNAKEGRRPMTNDKNRMANGKDNK